MIDILTGIWPWWVSGPLLGLMVPMLLLFGNKQFGVSSSLRHVCAAVLPLKADYFRYEWKSSAWNIALVAGVIVGGAVAVLFLNGDSAPAVSERAVAMFQAWGLEEPSALQPAEIFSPAAISSPPVLAILIFGGFLVGFGARYANGCTSGHSVMGLSLLSVGSLVAVIGFFIGGLFVAHLVIPVIMGML